MRIFYCAILFLSLWAASCKSTQSTTSSKSAASSSNQKIAFTQVAAGQYSAKEEEDYELIRYDFRYQQVWKEINSIFDPIPPAPKVDFEKQYTLAVYMGMRPNGGYSIKITDMYLEDDTLRVKGVSYKPGKNCMSTQAIVNPYQIVAFDQCKYKGLSISLKTEVQDCK